MALTDEVQKVGGSTKQELYDRTISWWFEGEKGSNDNLEWTEKKSELNENACNLHTSQLETWWNDFLICIACNLDNFTGINELYNDGIKIKQLTERDL